MKKRKSLIFGIIIALLLVTVILAILHLATRPQEQVSTLQICYNGETTSLPLSDLPLSDVSGTTVNGKGVEAKVDTKGTRISDVLSLAGVDPNRIEQVTVKAFDEFSAVLTAEDIVQPDKAYLIQEDDEEWPRLVVFGDPDSKRKVKDVVRLDVK